jgi:hypothetical protein
MGFPAEHPEVLSRQDNLPAAIAVVFLARGMDGGRSIVDAFFRSYSAHPAGQAHSLIVLTKGWEDKRELLEVEDTVRALQGSTFSLPDDGFDFGAYFRAMPQIKADWICILNGHSRILVDSWLQLLYRAASAPGVGAAGASGSWESLFRDLLVRIGSEPGAQLRNLARIAYYKWRFARFPSPHLRTNALVIRRSLFMEFAGQSCIPRTKRDAHALESGRRGLSSFLRKRGLDIVVAGADGRVYSPNQWRDSGTFRVPGHPNLIVADNQTRAFDASDEATQRFLHWLVWGGTQT